MAPVKHRPAGAAFLSLGIVFLAIAISGRQYAFIGVGSAFLTLGIVFLAKARAGR